jgi:hypothetical protein
MFVLCGAVACAASAERLPALERKFHDNLPSDRERAEFLGSGDAQRKAMLERTGLWSRWAALSAREREAAVRGEVAPGDREFVALMAWGPPADTQCPQSDSRAICFHTFIRCTSGPRAGRHVASVSACDGTSNEIRLAVEHGLVTQIKSVY